MDQLHLLWEYQKADVEVDKLAASIRRSPVRQKLVKYRDLYAEQQNAMKRIEGEVATMQDRLEALKDAIRMTNEQVHALHAKMESEEPKSAAEVQQYMNDAKRFQNNLLAIWKAPDDAPPEPPEPRTPLNTPARKTYFNQRLERIMGLIRQRAEARHIDNTLLGTRHDAESLVLQALQKLPLDGRLLHGWRATILQPALAEILTK